MGLTASLPVARAAALLAVTAVLLVGCDADPTPAPSGSGASGSSPGGTTGATSSGSAAPPSTPAASGTAGPTSGPATPQAVPGRFSIVVAGAGEVAYPVSGVTCTDAVVTAAATSPDGGTSGTVTLDAASGVLTVAGLPPLDGTRLTGTTTGTPAAGATVRWSGDGTGAAASLALSCP